MTALTQHRQPVEVPLLSVCIITFKRPALLAQSLGCIVPGKQTLDSSCYEILVSDDCPEGSARAIVESFPCVRWLKGPSRGVAANRNSIAKAARGDWIVYVDDDELPEPDWLARIHEAALSGQWEVIEGKVVPVSYPDSVFWYAPEVPHGGIFCTANMAIRRRTLFELGAFDERLTVSHEDVDLGCRIRSSGLPTIFLSQAVVYHPARKHSLGTVVAKAIQLQCQTYWLQHLPQSSPISRISRLLHLILWALRYLYACLRIQFQVTDRKRWRRAILENVVRIVCCPFAVVALLDRTASSDRRNA